MRKAYAAGGMIVRNATRGGGSGNSKNNGSNNKHAEDSSNSNSGHASGGGGSNGTQGETVPQESSPVVVTKSDPALLGAIKNGRIRGRNHHHQGNATQPTQHRNLHQLPPDVASLMAKNYRLAKELSELRVRHREECKKQTRLAMENMNLSSKYRDAIQQVIVLKKEVAYYQRRSETLAKNGIRAMPSPDATAVNSPPVPLSSTPSLAATPTAAMTTVQAVPSSSSSSPSSSPLALVTPRKSNGLADVVAEISRMDRILADHAAKSEGRPLPHQNDASMETPGVKFLKLANTESLTPSSTSSDDQASPEGTASPASLSSDRLNVASDDLDAEIEELGTPVLSDDLVDSDKETKEEWEPRRIRSKSPDHHHQTYFPHTASPKFRFNEEYPGDITASVRTGKSQRLSIGRLDEFKEDEEPLPTSLKPPHLSSGNSARRLPPSSSLSSIDAFEASFNTDFPDSFSPRDESPERPPREETYNPFSYSPATYDWSRPSASYSSLYVSPSDPPGRDRTSPPKKKPPTRRSPTSGDPSNGLLPRFNRMTENDKGSSPDVGPSSSSFASASTSSRTPLAGSGAFLLHTPPPPSPLASGESPPVTGSEALSTPSPSAVSTPPSLAVNYVPSSAMLEGMDLQQPAHDQPRRPEKTGFEAARARREKVLQPRLSHSEPQQSLRASPPPPPAPTSSPPLSEEKRLVKGLDPRSREAILLSARERLSTSALAAAATAAASATSSSSSPYSSPPLQRSKSLAARISDEPVADSIPASVPASNVVENYPNQAAILWGGNPRGGGGGGSSYEDDDGDIPLRSSLTKHADSTTSSSSLRRVTPKSRQLPRIEPPDSGTLAVCEEE